MFAKETLGPSLTRDLILIRFIQLLTYYSELIQWVYPSQDQLLNLYLSCHIPAKYFNALSQVHIL